MSHVLNGASQVSVEKLNDLLCRLECQAGRFYIAPEGSEREAQAEAECERLKQEIVQLACGEPAVEQVSG